MINFQMNVVVISDYGISDTSTLEDVNILDFIDEEDYQYIIYTSGYAKILPFALKHEEILLDCAEMEGVDVYLTDQVQDPPLWHGVEVPDYFKFGDGKYTQDILLVAKPAYQLITNVTDDRIINVNGITDDTLLKGGAGRNPYLLEPKLPRIERGIPPTPEEAQIISDHHDYQQYKYDMQTRAYMMGPGKSINGQ